jgi:hypothetical protein
VAAGPFPAVENGRRAVPGRREVPHVLRVADQLDLRVLHLQTVYLNVAGEQRE